MKKFAAARNFSSKFALTFRSTDVRPFVLDGIPAVSFGHYAAPGVSPIHTEYDVPESVSVAALDEESGFMADFAAFLAEVKRFPIPRTISPEIKKEAEKYRTALQ